MTSFPLCVQITSILDQNMPTNSSTAKLHFQLIEVCTAQNSLVFMEMANAIHHVSHSWAYALFNPSGLRLVIRIVVLERLNPVVAVLFSWSRCVLNHKFHTLGLKCFFNVKIHIQRLARTHSLWSVN